MAYQARGGAAAARDGTANQLVVASHRVDITSVKFHPATYVDVQRAATLELNTNLRYMETDRRGWMCMTLTAAECVAEWHLIDDVQSREYTSTIDRRLAVAAGRVSDGLYES